MQGRLDGAHDLATGAVALPSVSRRLLTNRRHGAITGMKAFAAVEGENEWVIHDVNGMP